MSLPSDAIANAARDANSTPAMLLPNVDRLTIEAMNHAPPLPTSTVMARSAMRTSPRMPWMSRANR